MELMTMATVQLPVDLDYASLDTLSRDVHDALASPAPIVRFVGATADTICLGLALRSPLTSATPTHAFAALLTTMHGSPKPLLAVVDGRAIGGGMGLACACDWAVATERATFALPELLWGLVPAIIWPVLAERMAPHVVRQWTVSAHARSAGEAHAAGLVDAVVPDALLDRAVARSARTLGRLDPVALQRLRGWMRESRRHTLPEALQLGADVTADMLGRPAVERRWQAFAAGEAPWSV